jgi:hypothetical protein
MLYFIEYIGRIQPSINYFIAHCIKMQYIYVYVHMKICFISDTINIVIIEM